MMMKYLIFGLLLSLTLQLQANDLKCGPQKSFYMSYDAMGKRDTISNVFNQINQNILMYNSTYTDEKLNTYNITSLHPQMYYNEHHQVEKYIDSQHVNVSLGDIELAFRCNYLVSKGGQNMTGWARGRVLVDQTAFFTKRLLIIDGLLQWDPVTISNLTATSLLTIEYSEPKLQLEDKATLENMINDHVGEKNLKGHIVEAFNSQYSVLLKKHLNSENIIPTINFDYKYKNLTFHFTNAVKEYFLEDKSEKGLRVDIFMEMQNFTTNCTEELVTFDEKKYGGLQGAISISTLSQSWRYAIQNGLLTATIDRSWEVPTFQFYMGDLANVVEEARNYPADDPFYATCHWDGNETNTVFTVYTQFVVYTQASVKCKLMHYSKELMNVDFDLVVTTKIIAEETTLTFRIQSANVYHSKFESIDPKFKVKDEVLGNFLVGEVVEGLVGRTTLGTGWKTVDRKFPGAIIEGKYLIILDGSQP